MPADQLIHVRNRLRGTDCGQYDLSGEVFSSKVSYSKDPHRFSMEVSPQSIGFIRNNDLENEIRIHS